MLRVIGHDAALLDGGLLAYDGPLETETAPRPEATFTPRPWPAERLATIDDAADTANVVIDARQRERFRGDEEAIDPRAGHIPGARSVPARENVDANGRFLGVEQLRANLRDAGSYAATTSCPTAAPASPPATTCSRSSTRASAKAASTPARGRSGATRRAPRRPATSPPARLGIP
jgi:3-mercaptopyruvate sulfurtransferase SseA